MAVSVIPTSSTRNHYRFNARLEKRLYTFVINYSTREDRWYLSLYRSGTPIIEGKKITVDIDLLATIRDKAEPLGILLSTDETGAHLSPAHADLGVGALLFYTDVVTATSTLAGT